MLQGPRAGGDSPRKGGISKWPHWCDVDGFSLPLAVKLIIRWFQYFRSLIFVRSCSIHLSQIIFSFHAPMKELGCEGSSWVADSVGTAEVLGVLEALAQWKVICWIMLIADTCCILSCNVKLCITLRYDSQALDDEAWNDKWHAWGLKSRRYVACSASASASDSLRLRSCVPSMRM